MEFIDVGIVLPQGASGIISMACPDCNDTRKNKNKKSLSVNVDPDNPWWKCHNCTFSGNLKAYKKYNEVREYANIPRELPEVYSKPVMDFLKSKGISVQTAKDEHIYEAKNNGHLVFPYFKGYNLVNAMFRPLDKDKDGKKKHPYQVPRDKGSEMVFWGLNKYDSEYRNPYDKKPCLIISEGQTDRLSFLEAGFKNVLSVPSGAPSPNSKTLEKALDYLKDSDFQQMLKDVREGGGWVFVCVDNDEAGYFLREALSRNIGRQYVKLGHIPQDYKDVNEVLVGNEEKKLKPLGKEGVLHVIEKAKNYPMFGIIEVKDVMDTISNDLTYGVKRGLGCGDDVYDKHIRFVKEKLYVITGVSGHKKSTWLRDYLKKLFIQNKELSAGLYTPEMMPPKKEIGAWAEAYAQKLLRHEFNSHWVMSPEERLKALTWAGNHITIVNPTRMQFEHDLIQNKSINSLDSVLKHMKYLVRSKGIDIMVIDAWNKLEHEYGRMSETHYVSMALDKVHEFNAKFGTSAFLVAHPTKMGKIGGKDQNPNSVMPTLDDISGSGNFRNKADVGIVIYEEKYIKTDKKTESGLPVWTINKDRHTTIHVEKCKDEEMGEEGMFEAKCIWSKGKIFQSIDPDNLMIDGGISITPQAGVVTPELEAPGYDFGEILADDENPF